MDILQNKELVTYLEMAQNNKGMLGSGSLFAIIIGAITFIFKNIKTIKATLLGDLLEKIETLKKKVTALEQENFQIKEGNKTNAQIAEEIKVSVSDIGGKIEKYQQNCELQNQKVENEIGKRITTEDALGKFALKKDVDKVTGVVKRGVNMAIDLLKDNKKELDK